MPRKTPKDRPTRRTVVIGGGLVLLGLTLLAYLIQGLALAAEIGLASAAGSLPSSGNAAATAHTSSSPIIAATIRLSRPSSVVSVVMCVSAERLSQVVSQECRKLRRQVLCRGVAYQ